ncbi:hypothetical protein AXG93_2528s2220 [Marchantia polymorpha subsp. ruderalis]|uniref:Mur ligase central domain-containing protein n=1 Tax=Marchantia polymorpha subsp. ruderalis TaxID=1480154 RepID=A0A176WQN8_MARPO|nr:hypothetical protein AXG93_2528s2220 [Marchantia polymorpha subsp. ruderalis]
MEPRVSPELPPSKSSACELGASIFYPDARVSFFAPQIREVNGAGLKSDLWSSGLDWRESVQTFSKRNTKVVVTVMQSRQDLTGKNVVVVGLGASGRAAVKLALARGATVVAVDSNPNTLPVEVDLHPAAVSRLRTEFGPHNRETLFGASQLVLSPGVSASQPDIAAAIQAGVPALSELSFAAAALPKSIQLAAVSGTNGKSTVTTFAGQRRVVMAFCRFTALHPSKRAFIDKINSSAPPTRGALLLDARQLSDGPWQRLSKSAVIKWNVQECFDRRLLDQVGVILNLTPDHLERHKTMETYGKMKCRIFAQMGPANLAVIPQSDTFLRKLAAESGSKGTRAWLGGLPAVGLHNAHNAGSAALIALALVDFGVSEESIQSVLPTLQPPPHRMEVVHQDEQEILWVNDSKATNVDATYVGIKGIVGRKAVILIGGLAKVLAEGNLGFERLGEVLNSHRAVILFGASGEQIEEELRAAAISVPCVRAENLKDAVKLARSFVQPGFVLCVDAVAEFFTPSVPPSAQGMP